jgi:PiT family inorganic phosphate transporter
MPRLNTKGAIMLIFALLLLFSLFMAYANGANDNFKGVATLYGSGTATYKRAITVATAATFAGSVASIYMADALVKQFSGRGIVSSDVVSTPVFAMAVAAAAAATVLLATWRGLPISTTHALIGGIIGAGAAAIGPNLNLSVLGAQFVAPLLVGPLVAIGLTATLYWFMHRAATRLRVTRETCLCVGSVFVPVARFSNAAGDGVSPARAGLTNVTTVAAVGSTAECYEKYTGEFFGFRIQPIVDGIHYASAVGVSFARGMNDTPKLVALLLVIPAWDIQFGCLAIAIGMAVGGLLNARKVALTMSKKISKMNDGQACTANLVTALLVICATPLALPLSTTHVATGSIVGIGLTNGTANMRVLSSVLAAWLFTMPVAAALGAAVYYAGRLI